MEFRVSEQDKGVYIEINDASQGWMPLFGGNSEGDFVGMPTCWPYDQRSEPGKDSVDLIHLDIDLLLQRKTLDEIRQIVQTRPVSSIPGVTFMSALSDRNGNMLHIIPGQGNLYYEKPEYAILTNFSPFKKDGERHPWMGLDRYRKAEEMIKNGTEDFDVKDGFDILKAVAQEVCPTVVSMVYDISEKTIFWCMDRNWNSISIKKY